MTVFPASVEPTPSGFLERLIMIARTCPSEDPNERAMILMSILDTEPTMKKEWVTIIAGLAIERLARAAGPVGAVQAHD